MKTHCPQGHPYDEANTIHRKGGGRGCRACDNARSRATYVANREVRKAKMREAYARKVAAL